MQEVEIVRELLEEIRAVRRAVDRLEKPLPAVLTKDRAAEELSISRTTLQGLIRSTDIGTVTVGKREMVPASEVRRLATLHSAPKRSTTKEQKPRRSASERAAAMRAAIKAQR